MTANPVPGARSSDVTGSPRGVIASHLDGLRCDSFPAAIGAAIFLLHLFTAKGYGFFRDELYYLVSAEHLDFGYVEHPPLVVLVAWLARSVLGDSIYAARFFPALAAGVTVYLTAAVARQLGGGRFAQTLGSVAVALAPAYMGLFGVLSMNAFDILFWTLGVLVVARILTTGDERLWVVFGTVTGIGLQNKTSILLLGFGVVVGLVLCRRWRSLTSRWLWLGGSISLLLFAPHLWWQVAHGWPTLEFMHNATAYKNLPMSPLAFLGEQVLQMNPVALPLWLAGLWYCLGSRDGRRYRALGWAYLSALLVLLTQNAKPYYLAPFYPVLFASGALLLGGPAWKAIWLRAIGMAVLVVSGAALAPLAKPLLPVETYVRYASALGFAPRTEERQELGRLPQQFADMHGWPELAEAVADVYRDLAPEDRGRACVFGQNYGEAGAIDFFGKAYDLPRAISGHNSYFLWGPGECTGEVLIVIGGRREEIEGSFEEVTEEGRFTCRDCMPYENNRSLWVARRLRLPIEEVWPRVKRFI